MSIPRWVTTDGRIFFCVLFLNILIAGCQTNPYTQRSQLLLMPSGQMNQMGAAQYSEVLQDPKVVISKDPKEIEPVTRVAARIIEAAKRSKYGDVAKAFDWEVTVIKDDNTKNAWALPGGKIAVYTGIFPMAKNEAGLAAIMGHEVVHALAEHGGERMSQGLVAQFGMTAAAIVLSTQGQNPALNALAMQAMGLGVQTGVLLPFSRKHESEADYIGILLAGDAGYDPREAIHIWERMAAASDGAPPEFLSTHPAHETRIADLTKWMPEAMELYRKAPKAPVANLPLITPSPLPRPPQQPNAARLLH
ncbi:M48 family metallopeptidase [Candidatus Nitrospira allomarina]|uniref:M48 family metallopeptidase n=1 Tax=Candidatus Nitrospira allomarina TaxID=3020900 RepID=A0AA96GAG4_9BACT|nr:M48 family metallopeptidase [Candidatus Nitrospira allomarina]WNM57442.1 M48 family metallopeptidase [Candidatus Nitrospira allomarina]